MSGKQTRRNVLVGAGVIGLFAVATGYGLMGSGSDSATDVTAEEAFARQQAGEMIIVDVRRPDEWRQTGIASGAQTIEMQDPVFLQKIAELRQSNPDKQIGFICASSNRSGQVQAYLADEGVREVYSVYGGMNGNGRAPGWIADGLPVEPWTEN